MSRDLAGQSNMGKKREKGKARKAKVAAAAQEVARAAVQAAVQAASQAWRGWAMGLKQDADNRCTHACPALPDPDHAVSLFMDALWTDAFDHVNSKGPFKFLRGTIDNHHKRIWDNATFRKLVLDIMLAIGTNFIILAKSEHEYDLTGNLVFMSYLGHAISTLEQYDGNGSYKVAMFKAIRAANDVVRGGEREFIRFFLKRACCTCLKATYSVIKKSHPIRMGVCSTCDQAKELRSLFLCGHCKVSQDCCRECQAADWPNHKVLCSKIP